MTREVTLTKGYVALVDDEDYEAVAPYRWYAVTLPGRTYARAFVGGEGQGRPSPNRRRVFMHRLLAGLDAAQRHVHVDYINGNGLDNRRTNLRIATNAENSANQRRKRVATTSRFKGVMWDKRRGAWRAQVGRRTKTGYLNRHLGYFQDEEQAARAYDAAAVEMFGEFAGTNAAMGLLGLVPR